MDDNVKKKELSGSNEDVIRTVMNYRLLDDDFMKVVFNDCKPAASVVLRVILNKPDLVVDSVKSEELVINFGSRSIRVDVLAREKGKVYNIEIQRADRGADPRRARYHGSLLDARELKKGASFEELPETYVIFITENDIYGKGRPLYWFDRRCIEADEILDDGLHIIYVNGKYRGDDPVGNLMRDFACTSAVDMHYNELAERVRYFKETEEGLASMCRSVEELVEKYEEKGRAEGRAEGADRLGSLMTKLKQLGREDDAFKAAADSAYREKLFKEFGIA